MQPFRIAIDPGHGGRDPGAVAGDIFEKDLNLNLSAYLFKLCLNRGLNPSNKKYLIFKIKSINVIYYAGHFSLVHKYINILK